jgi:hypothetical protein
MEWMDEGVPVALGSVQDGIRHVPSIEIPGLDSPIFAAAGCRSCVDRVAAHTGHLHHDNATC